jgi:hypothetical protein
MLKMGTKGLGRLYTWPQYTNKLYNAVAQKAIKSVHIYIRLYEANRLIS